MKILCHLAYLLPILMHFSCSFATHDNNLPNINIFNERAQYVTIKKSPLKYANVTSNDFNNRKSQNVLNFKKSQLNLLRNDNAIKIKTILSEPFKANIKLCKAKIQQLNVFFNSIELPIQTYHIGIRYLNEIIKFLDSDITKLFISKTITMQKDEIKKLIKTFDRFMNDLKPYYLVTIPNIRLSLHKDKEKLELTKIILKMLPHDLINSQEIIKNKNDEIKMSIRKLDSLESNLCLLILCTIPSLKSSLQNANIELDLIYYMISSLEIKLNKYRSDVYMSNEKLDKLNEYSYTIIASIVHEGLNYLQDLRFNRKYLEYLSRLHVNIIKAHESIKKFEEQKKEFYKAILDILRI